MKKSVIILLILFSVLTVKSQNTTSRLWVQGEEGETIYFTFNSFEKYRNGMSMTRIATVGFIDTTDGGAQTALRWELNVKALTGNIVGDYGNNLPLSTIEIEATGDDVLATYSGPIALTNMDNVHLVQDGTQTPGFSFTTLTLTYHVGTTTPLLGEKPDYYFVDIQYTLQPQ